MKRLLLLLAVFCSAEAASYSRDIIYVLEQLRQVEDPDRSIPFIGGCAVGEAGQPGTFYLLHEYLKHRASAEDAAIMLKDKSPAVRLMGAKLLLHDKLAPEHLRQADLLLTDTAQVELSNFGCMVERTTVGEIVRRLKEDPTLLNDIEPGPVTPPAPSQNPNPRT